MKLRFAGAAISLSLIFTLPIPAQALMTPHPVDAYEKGRAILMTYRGDDNVLDEAEQVFEELVRRHPRSPFGYLGISQIAIIKSFRYGNHFNMKIIRNRALPYAVKALELGPSLQEVHENYGIFEGIFEKFYQNQKRTQQYLSMFPDNPETYFEVANFICDLEEFERAVDYYSVALEMNPPEHLKLKILKRLAHLYLHDLDSPAKAAETYLQALQIKNESPVVNEFLGIAYLELKEYGKAVTTLGKSKALLSNENSQEYWLKAKAYLSQQQGQYDDAIQYFERAARLDQRNGDLHYELGNLYFQKANYENAFSHFKRAIDLRPQKTNAYFFAGRSAESMGDAEAALDYYKRYLSLNGDSQEAEWIRTNKPEAVALPDRARLLDKF